MVCSVLSGKIYVVGIGPGGSQYMTPQALEAIRVSNTVVGYTVYVDLLGALVSGKEVMTSAMKQEAARAKMALDAALLGKCVSFVCSGDAGVYGMAGIMREVASDHPEIEIITVPGITAALSGAALLGAPLIHDFAVISLSDLLTPWNLIEKRLTLAAKADFVICLYNPKSRRRKDHLDRAVDLIMKARPGDVCCGYVRNIGRDGEKAFILRLSELKGNDDIDMFTTVFIGNSATRELNGKLVTPRGYRNV